MNYKIVRSGEKIMKISQAIGLVAIGTLLFQMADIARSNYVSDRDTATNQLSPAKYSPAEIDRSNRERAKDYAFLYNNPSLEEPMYQQLTKTAPKSQP
jgi:hypothetical protein